MNDKSIDEALKYADASNKIEDLSSTKDELESIKAAILSGSRDESFLFNVVKKIMQEENYEEVKNDKARK